MELQIEEEKERQRLAAEQKELEKQMCKLKLLSKHPVSGERMEKKLEVHQDTSLLEALKQAHRLLELNDVVPLDRCRLVKYDQYSETFDQSLDLEEDGDEQTFGKLVGGARADYTFELFLEIRKEGEKFRKYGRGGMNLCILIVDVTTENVSPPVLLRAEQGWTVMDLKQEIGKTFGLSHDTMNLVQELYNGGKHLKNDTHSLKGEEIYRKHNIYVCSDPEDFQKPYPESVFRRIVDSCVNFITLIITLPPSESVSTSSSSDAPGVEGRKEQAAASDDVNKVGAENSPDVVPVEEKPKEREIRMRIERRTTLAQLKEKLEPTVGVDSSNFKVYRVYSNDQDYEMERVKDTLTSIPTESRLIVRLGRALRPGEHRIKLYLLKINQTEYSQFIMEIVVLKGCRIGDFKKQILAEAKDQGVELELHEDRMRLRKKTWRSPGTIYLDDQLMDKDIYVYAGSEMYIEPLEAPEKMMNPTQMQVYCRQWSPSKYTIGPFQEIILDSASPEGLRKKVSTICDIPADRVGIAKSFGVFPCEVSVLDMEKEMDWNPVVTNINHAPLSLYDDGGIIYYKDLKEEIGELTQEQRDEIMKSDEERRSKASGN